MIATILLFVWMGRVPIPAACAVQDIAQQSGDPGEYDGARQTAYSGSQDGARQAAYSGSQDGARQAAYSGSQDGPRQTRHPDRYDARQQGLVTEVKRQWPYGSCWAFALTAAGESSLIRSGFADRSLDLSEYHLAYFSDTASTDLSDTLNRGSSLGMAVAYLTGGGGLLYESELPYESAVRGISPDPALAAQADFTLQRALFADPEEKAQIKELILQCGAAAVSYYHAERYEQCAWGVRNYHIPNAKAKNHAVCVIGWADHYPREYFRVKPKRDGAWLCKDSGGSGENGTDGGFLWISYETAFAEVVALELRPARGDCAVTETGKGAEVCVDTGKGGDYNIPKGRCSDGRDGNDQ
ncbi:MAG: hypothetical protein J6P60_02475 [Lachnospiraceae bacterium]|nr:hypothetical protein [Lachnospiraceae bacterium]